MRPFAYQRAVDIAQATHLGTRTGQGQIDARAQFLAGGTSLIDLMKLDVLRPEQIVDLGSIRPAYNFIDSGPDHLRLGAFARMSAVARHPTVLKQYPALAESLQLAASAQLRNMATLGGNVLQKTRCPYYRDVSWKACNKRAPGSGCTAISAPNRNHAILGVDSNCISQYPGDFGVALIALDAMVELQSLLGLRRIPFSELHVPVGPHPQIETSLRDGEVITAFQIPATSWYRRSVYLKVRDRASYEFALASAAVALDLDGARVRQVRIALGGVAYRPWRSPEAEASLVGQQLTEKSADDAARVALQSAKTHGGNDFKPELARRTLVRALLQAQRLEGIEA